MSKYFFIINPVNKTKANSLEREIHSFFSNRKDDYQISFSNNSIHIKQLTTSAINQKVDVIIACGGDGTISEIGQDLINKKIKLGIIPIGSGNGISGHFKIPHNFSKALEIIVNGYSQKMDVGKVDNKYFFSNIGFGIEVEFIRHYTQSNIHGLYGYIISFIKSLFSYKASVFHIEVGNENISNKPHVLMISNTNKQGYGISISKNAKTNDGFLDLTMIDKTNMIYINYLIFKILFGFSIADNNKVKYMELKDFKIKSKDYFIKFQIDGEYNFSIKNELTISVVPNAIDVLC